MTLRPTYADILNKVASRKRQIRKQLLNTLADEETIKIKQFIHDHGLMAEAVKGTYTKAWYIKTDRDYNFTKDELNYILRRIKKLWHKYHGIRIAVKCDYFTPTLLLRWS